MVVAASIAPEPGSALAAPPGLPFVLLFAKRLDQAYLTDLATDFGLAPLRMAAAMASRSKSVSAAGSARTIACDNTDCTAASTVGGRGGMPVPRRRSAG